MAHIDIPAQILAVYLLAHLRFIGLIFTSPLFFSSMTPMPFRYLFVTLLTVASIATVSEAQISLVLFESWISISVLALREFLIGALIGLLASLPLTALNTAGEQIGIAMGFSMASVVDPMTQSQSSVVGQLQFLVGLWFYFHWNGHLLMLKALTESLKLIPLGTMALMPEGDMGLGLWLQEVFMLAMKIVIPFYCALVLSDIGLGFLARTVPQMNIFVLGLPVKVALGFFVLTAALPLTVDMIYNHVERWIEFALKSALVWR